MELNMGAEALVLWLYEKFRPDITTGVSGWGAAGVLDLDAIERLAKK